MCKFDHPKICRKFTNFGSAKGGCSKGNDYEFTHPKLCKFSQKLKKCPYMKDGERCRFGYHVKGIVYCEVNETVDKCDQKSDLKRDHKRDSTEKVISGDSGEPKDFLLSMIRMEVKEIMKELIPKTHPEQPRNVSQTGRDYLCALLRKNPHYCA